MAFGFFKSKKEKATLKALDPTKDNMSRVRALDQLEEFALTGDEEAINTLFRCFQITVKPDKQEKSLTPYDDEQEKHSLIDRLVTMSDLRLTVLKLLRKELSTPPALPPGRRDGIVWLIELLKQMAEETTDDESESALMVRDELIVALEHFDPEETYREPGRKLELIQALGRHPSEETTNALIPYLFDFDESVRFRAVETLSSAGNAGASEKLCDVLLDDESLRIRQRAGEVIAKINCTIKGHPRRKEIEAQLPKNVMVDKQGVVKRRG